MKVLYKGSRNNYQVLFRYVSEFYLTQNQDHLLQKIICKSS